MKKISLLFISLMVINNCSFNPKLLQPNGENLTSKLLPLEFGLLPKLSTSEDISYQSYISTLFKREFEKNVFIDDRQKYGYIDLTLIYDESKPIIIYSIFSPISFLISYLGTPISMQNREIELQLTIYDKNKNIVKVYVDKFDDLQTINWYNFSTKPKNKQLEIISKIIENIKLQLLQDIPNLNKELREVYFYEESTEN